MKEINNYIQEKLVINKDSKCKIIKVKDKIELRSIIEKRAKESHYLDLTDIDISNVISLSSLFKREDNIVEVNITGWETKQVQSMRAMFYENMYLKKVIGLGDLNISNVTSMNFMFSNCINLVDVGDLSQWEINNNISMVCAFQNCKKLKTLGDITHWRFSELISNVFSLSPIQPLPKKVV